MENIELKIRIKNQEKLPDFMDLLEGLDYVEVEDDTKEAFLSELREAVDEVKSDMKGEVKLKSAESLIDEL